jgi:hypothetical protein
LLLLFSFNKNKKNVFFHTLNNNNNELYWPSIDPVDCDLLVCVCVYVLPNKMDRKCLRDKLEIVYQHILTYPCRQAKSSCSEIIYTYKHRKKEIDWFVLTILFLMICDKYRFSCSISMFFSVNKVTIGIEKRLLSTPTSDIYVTLTSIS